MNEQFPLFVGGVSFQTLNPTGDIEVTNQLLNSHVLMYCDKMDSMMYVLSYEAMAPLGMQYVFTQYSIQTYIAAPTLELLLEIIPVDLPRFRFVAHSAIEAKAKEIADLQGNEKIQAVLQDLKTHTGKRKVND